MIKPKNNKAATLEHRLEDFSQYVKQDDFKEATITPEWQEGLYE